jgi:general secretion pathway protein A
MHLKYFGLSEKAFSLSPDPGCFYINRSYREAFIALRYAIRLRAGLIVLTGPAGIGKTSLIGLVKEQCEESIRLAVISARDQEFLTILTRIMRALGIEGHSAAPDGMLAEIKTRLVEQLETENIAAVILDDAQELSAPVLRDLQCLLELQSARGSLLPIILAGRPELEQMLEQSDLRPVRSRVALWARLEPLRADEVGNYIERRLRCGGNAVPGVFTPAAIAGIAALSNGIPGVINTICDRSLARAFEASEGAITAATVEHVWHGLELTGETDFEVAALLAEMRDICIRPTYDALAEVRYDRSIFGWHSDEALPTSNTETSGQADAGDLAAAPIQHENCEVGTIGKIRSGDRIWKTMFSGNGVLRDRRWRGLELSGVALLFVLGGAIVFVYKMAADFSATVPQDRAVTSHTASTEPTPVKQNSAKDSATEPQPAPRMADQQTTKSLLRNDMAAVASSRSSEAHDTRAVVFVHTSEARDRRTLEELGAALGVHGYTVRDIRITRNKTEGDVRFFFRRDREDAKKIKSLVQSELGRRGYSVTVALLERDGRRFQFAAPGKIEVWLPPLRSTHLAG